MPSEFSITFSGAGGHDHSGIAGSGSLISTSLYSIFDWNTSTIGDQTRIERQVRNKQNLENWIIELVNSREISPRVLRLKPASLDGKIIIDGTLEANKIIAGSITGPLLANGSVSGVNIAANTITANNIQTGTITGVKIQNNAITDDKVQDISIVKIDSDFTLLSNAIQSNVYTAGVSGWSIFANGDAEFNDVIVRGTVVATSGSIGAYNINSSIFANNTVPQVGRDDNYRLTLGSDATIDARLIYDYDNVNDTHNPGGFTSRVLINQGSVINGASIIVNSSGGSNSVITPGIVDVNVSVTAPSIYGTIYATTAGGGNTTPVHQNGSGAALTRATSKRIYKYDIKDFEDYGLIDKLKPRLYKWKAPIDYEETEQQKYIRENTFDIGFIAEEVAEIENGRLANFEDDERNVPSFWKYLDIIALLVAEVQDLRKRVKKLEDGV